MSIPFELDQPDRLALGYYPQAEQQASVPIPYLLTLSSEEVSEIEALVTEKMLVAFRKLTEQFTG